MSSWFPVGSPTPSELKVCVKRYQSTPSFGVKENYKSRLLGTVIPLGRTRMTKQLGSSSPSSIWLEQLFRYDNSSTYWVRDDSTNKTNTRVTHSVVTGSWLRPIITDRFSRTDQKVSPMRDHTQLYVMFLYTQARVSGKYVEMDSEGTRTRARNK